MERLTVLKNEHMRLKIDSVEALTLTCTEGHGHLKGQRDEVQLNRGQTVIVPAETQLLDFSAAKNSQLVLGGKGQTALVQIS